MPNLFKIFFKLKKLILAVIILLIVVVLIVGAYFYWQNKDKKVTLEVYGTSADNNTRQVENILVLVKQRLGGRVAITIRLVTDRDDQGNFMSYNLINNQEELADFDVQENIRQLVIKKYYPEKYLDFLVARNANFFTDNWQAAASYVGIKDFEKINQLVEQEGSELLNQEIDDFENWRDSLAAPPNTIPNLLIAGELYTGSADLLSVSAAVAKKLLRQGRDSLPQSPYKSLFSDAILISSPFSHSVDGVTECYNDFHCDDKPDREGFCADFGSRKTRCVYFEPAKVDLFILAGKDYDKDDDVLHWSIKQNIKGVTTTVVDLDSKEGGALKQELNPTYFPAYVFAKNLESTKYFNLLKARNNFVAVGDWYLLNVQPPPTEQELQGPEPKNVSKEKPAEKLETTEGEGGESEEGGEGGETGAGEEGGGGE